MAKIIFMLKRKPGTTKEQFREHYENVHAELAKKYIGHLLLGYHRNYPVHAGKNPTAAPGGVPFDFEYDVVTEMRVKDAAAVEEIARICNDPEIQPIFVEDENKFLDRSQTVLLVCDETNTGTAPR